MPQESQVLFMFVGLGVGFVMKLVRLNLYSCVLSGGVVIVCGGGGTMPKIFQVQTLKSLQPFPGLRQLGIQL